MRFRITLMRHKEFFPACLFLFGIAVLSPALAQDAPVVCKQTALAALKPMPSFHYRCDPKLEPYDEKVLRLPARLQAKDALVARLETLTSPAWWRVQVDDLNACDFRHKPGVIAGDALRDFKGGDYRIWLFGDGNIRMVVLPDPCYQSDYNGSVSYVLYHKGPKVFASQVIDNFFSRADNPILMDRATQGAEEIVEVATWTGGLNPSLTNYYFSIDPGTYRAVPRNLFVGDHGPTNEITSAMLFGTPEDFDLPADAGEIKVFRNHRLAKTISLYADDTDGKIEDNGRKLTRTVLTWNGKVYK
jgi:hypothetical protein